MANTDRPNGARAVKRLDGGACLPANPYPVDASNGTAIFPGDFVKREADGNVAPAAAGNRILGVCVDVLNDYDDLSRRHLPASTAGDILVIDDPFTIFEVQADDDGTALTSAELGANCDILAGSGDTTTSISAHEIDSSTVTTGAAQLRLLRLVDREDNEHGDFGKYEVLINEHEYNQTSGV